MKADTAPSPDWTAPRKPRRVREHHRTEPVDFRLWLPLTPLCLALAPFAWLCLPLVALCCIPWRLNPVSLIAGIGEILLSASGTDIDIRGPDTLFRIRIV